MTSELEEERRGRKRAEQELKVITPVYRYNIILTNRTIMFPLLKFIFQFYTS